MSKGEIKGNLNYQINKTLESTFQKESPDGVAVLPPNKLAYQSYRIRVLQLFFFVMILGAKLLTPSTTLISANFWTSGTCFIQSLNDFKRRGGYAFCNSTKCRKI